MGLNALQPNESGLKLLYQEHRQSLFRFLVARCGDAADAEDILQNLWLRLDALQAAPIANGRSYLFRMAQNLVLDRLRERHRRELRDREWTMATFESDAGATDVIDQQGSAEANLIKGEDLARLARAIAELPPGAARAFRLHKLDGLSHGDVAAQLGISRSGVEKHIAVAMAHLRRSMGDD
ncbi:MAG: polymerase subunit sigma-70 [Sphingomonas bacterium]|nr:polymerase subunit sigma-70 [Sphingomonas bacterium]